MRNLTPSDVRLAVNLASLALVIGIGGAIIAVASSSTFSARRETNSVLFSDLLQFRSDLVLILEWNEEDVGDASNLMGPDLIIGGSGDTNVSFIDRPAIRVTGASRQQPRMIIGGSGNTNVSVAGGAFDQRSPSLLDRKERLQRARFFLQDMQHHCCFRSERRIICNLLDVVRRLSQSQTSTARRITDTRSSPSRTEHDLAPGIRITSILFQALWFCLCLSSTCFGTSTALFLRAMAPDGVIESIIGLSFILIFPGVVMFLFFCRKHVSPASFSRTHSH